MPRDRSVILRALLILVATVAAYVPALGAGYIWDDDLYVIHNASLRDLDGLRRIWFDLYSEPQYYPMVHTTFWIEYQIWKLRPEGYHAVNVLLHAANALLVWRLLRRLAVPGAWIAGAVFALHPVHVESAAWITERKNVLSTLFYLGAAFPFLRFFGIGDGAPAAAPGARRPWGAYALGTALFVAALLSKTVTSSLPAALLLVVWWKRGRIGLREAGPALPLLALGAVAGLTTAWIEKVHVGAEGAAWDLSFLERCLIAGRAVWFYVSKLAWPSNLAFIYPRWEIDAGAAWQWVFPIGAVLAVAALALARGRLGRGPLAAALFFGGTLFPALGFVDVFPMRYSFVADHFQYAASLGPIALGSAGVALAVRRLGPAFLPVARTAGALALVLLGTLTWRQARAYESGEALWRDTLEKNPRAWMAHTNLGLILSRKGQVEEAMEHYRESIRLDPTLVEPRLNLAWLLKKRGRADEAMGLEREAVRLRPDHAYARFNLGSALAVRGDYEEAIVHLSEAARLRPDLPEAQYNLATAFLRLGRLDEAAARYERTLRIKPDHHGAHTNLAYILETRGRAAEAAVHRAEALRIRAWTLATHDDPAQRDGARAIELAREACQRTGYAQARPLDSLAAAYAETGRFAEAVSTAERARDLARASGEPGLAAAIEARLEIYRSGRPIRDLSTRVSTDEPTFSMGRRPR